MMTEISQFRDQAQRLRQLAQEANKPATIVDPRVITISSGKGGVGKTNLTVNLGIALAQKGVRVGILDADLGLANLDIVLGVIPEYNLSHVLRGEKNIQDVVAVGPAGVKIFAGGSGLYDLANVPQAQLVRFIDGLRDLDGMIDVCLIDTGAGIDRQVMSFVSASQEAVIVTTPEPTAITDAYGVIKVLHDSNPQTRIKIVVNMAGDSSEGWAVFERLKTVSQQFLNTNIAYLGCVEEDPAVSKAVREQRPLVVGYPNARASRGIFRLADELLRVGAADPLPREGIKGIFQRMARRLQRSL